MTTGLLGGTFNPPHYGHLALAEAAKEHFELDDLLVLVNAHPGHKEVEVAAESRLRLARAAFPDYHVELDPYERTVDMLRARRRRDPIFLVGADSFSELLTWKEPDQLLALARLGVATRPGYPQELLQPVLDRLARPERVEFFEIEPVPISSQQVRDRVFRGEPIDALVPPAVAEEIEALGLYREG
jgi:nicotinate-nucleotide adenylyltransferase